MTTILTPEETDLKARFDALPVEILQDTSTAIEPRRPCGGYWTTEPHPRQGAFLLFTGREALFGGAAGGGKSWALLLAALQYVCVPGYRALLLRRTYKQLSGDDGLIQKSHLLLDHTDAVYHPGDYRWTFPSGASITFGYLQYEQDKLNYSSLAYQYVGFDELTHWPISNPYTYVGFSRVRRPAPSDDLARCPGCGLSVADVPLRTRSGTNPGSPGAQWVYDRFVMPWEKWRAGEIKSPKRKFVRSLISDNPSLDQESYIESLEELGLVEREQLLRGDWSIKSAGGMFKRQDFNLVNEVPIGASYCRYWDMAATVPNDENPDPDWTAGVLMATVDGRWYVADVVKIRGTPAQSEALILQTAHMDANRFGYVKIRMEQEPGASGKIAIAYYQTEVLVGFDFDGHSPGTDKITRAKPFSNATENGNTSMVIGLWNSEYLDELEVFPKKGFHDDQVDGSSGGFSILANDFVKKKRMRIIV